jgi:hypothetical protein
VDVRVPPGDALLHVARVVRHGIDADVLEHDHRRAPLDDAEEDVSWFGSFERDVEAETVSIERQRGAAMIMFKDVGVEPVPNYTRDVKKGIARWDAYVHVPDPDALAAEFSSRNVALSEPLQDTSDGLRGFELKDADGYVLFFGRPR